MNRDITGKWHNQHGSEMDLRIDPQGRLRGTFRSGIGFPDPEDEFEVTGFAAGDLVGFVVSFAKYDSLTSWTGHFGSEEGRETIYALWHMSVGLIPGRDQELRQGIWSGSDTFLRECATAGEDRRRAKPSHPTGDGARVAASG